MIKFPFGRNISLAFAQVFKHLNLCVVLQIKVMLPDMLFQTKESEDRQKECIIRIKLDGQNFKFVNVSLLFSAMVFLCGVEICRLISINWSSLFSFLFVFFDAETRGHFEVGIKREHLQDIFGILLG